MVGSGQRSEGRGQGIELFNLKKPDIVLMDVMMPGMDGFEACQLIRQSPGGQLAQILMVTGLEDTESIEKAFRAGANDFVAKPLSLVMLGQRVQYMQRAGQAFRELHISQSRLAKTQELARIGHWQVDLRSHEFHCSPEAAHLLGLAQLDQGKTDITLEDFLSPVLDQDRNRIRELLEQTLKTQTPATLEYRIYDEDNAFKYILNKSEIILDEQAQPALLQGIVQDISQLKKAEEEIRFLAFYDGLTGLANRMLFMDRLDQTLADAKRNNHHFALLFLDLDNFKGINDTLGHQIGDLLLKKVAERIKNSTRNTDSATRIAAPSGQNDSVIARLGGDEFTILVPHLKDPEYASLIARRLLRTIPEGYTIEGHEVTITTSIGISIFPEDGTQADILLKNADNAMYHAKKLGKNTFQYFTNAMNKASIERYSIDRDLKKAIQNQEFVLYYQPQIRLSDRKIVGAEALIRWFHPHRGMIPPDKFISVAEESGFILDINQWVLSTACRQGKAWKEMGLPSLTLAVNLSGYKLADQNLAQSIAQVLEQEDLVVVEKNNLVFPNKNLFFQA